MKFATAFGGFLGFVLVCGAGLVARRDPAGVLLEASFACVIGGLLGRWMMRLLVSNVHAAHLERRRARAARPVTPVAPPVTKAQPAKS